MNDHFILSQPHLQYDWPARVDKTVVRVGETKGPLPKTPDDVRMVFQAQGDGHFSFTWPKNKPPALENFNAWFFEHAVSKGGRERGFVTADLRARAHEVDEDTILVLNGPTLPDLKRLGALLLTTDGMAHGNHDRIIRDGYFDWVENKKEQGSTVASALIAPFFPNLVLLRASILRTADFAFRAATSIKTGDIETTNSARERLNYRSEILQILGKYGKAHLPLPGDA